MVRQFSGGVRGGAKQLELSSLFSLGFFPPPPIFGRRNIENTSIFGPCNILCPKMGGGGATDLSPKNSLDPAQISRQFQVGNFQNKKWEHLNSDLSKFIVDLIISKVRTQRHQIRHNLSSNGSKSKT
ncbi:hypothetical protein KFK09_003664 [Dendrobium nobile]|uniref:Uncharacterized protein n=1 Tax=Dendrobium nobile TaxID=94219 RepID=A0A8T3C439_DENNO|nr:hypothetical protein KFK09_003664 [Dendrobium nobile]